jgi:hypothetical protein
MTWPPPYNPPYDAELSFAQQCFFGRATTSPQKHKVRFFGPFESGIPFWISNMVYGYDRSITEWTDVIQKYKHHSLYFPFVRQHIMTLERLVKHELTIRRLVQKFVRNVRMRVFARRRIGSVDLYTMTPVPHDSQVRVFDYASKSLYVFHTQTAIRIIDSGLIHSNYGIPTPHMPRNPYTNITFTQAQLISMMTQIGLNCARAHRFPPPRVLNFRKYCYDVVRFKNNSKTILNWEAAVTFLHSFHDPISIDFYMEVLNDTVDVENLNMPRWNEVREYVRNRSAPSTVLKRFDTVVLSLFLFENHSTCYSFASYTDMLDEVENAYRVLVRWRSRVGPATFQSGTQNVLTP